MRLVDYNELAETYSIPPEEVESIIVSTIGDTLSQALNSLVIIKAGQAYLYAADGIREILPEELEKNIKRMINFQVCNVLDATMATRKLSGLIRYENQIVWGEASWREGYLVVDLEGIPAVGFCKLGAVAPKERPAYNKLLSGRRAYYVSKASREKPGQLILNRTSNQLPKLLIESLAWDAGVNTTVTVNRRKAGGWSMISLSEKVPGSVLLATRMELNEKILVAPPVRVV